MSGIAGRKNILLIVIVSFSLKIFAFNVSPGGGAGNVEKVLKRLLEKFGRWWNKMENISYFCAESFRGVGPGKSKGNDKVHR